MSHFVTVVLVPNDGRVIQTHVESVLSRYDENLEVPEYDQECSCVNWTARRDGENAVNFHERLNEV